jgi:hypothetical protein
MIQPDNPDKSGSTGQLMVLRFPAIFWFVVCLFLFAGAIADWYWLGPEFRGEPQSFNEIQYFLLTCPIIAVGGILIGSRIIRVTAEKIESSHCFFRTSLNRKTCRACITSSGFVLVDASGARIHVHRLMIGAGELYELVSDVFLLEGGRAAMEDAIAKSPQAQRIKRLKLIKPAILLIALFVSGVMLIFDVGRDWIQAVKENGPIHIGEVFLFSLGVGLVMICIAIFVQFIRKRAG